MKFPCLVLVTLGFGSLAFGHPALAGSDIYLIYPQSSCQGVEGDLLHFTTTELGSSDLHLHKEPSHGRIFFDLGSVQGGYYLPRCESLMTAGFDFFQLESRGSVSTHQGLIHVTVLLDDGSPLEYVVEERAVGGQIGHPWVLVQENPSVGVDIVEWISGQGLGGTHGFGAVPDLQADSYLSYRFPGDFDGFQPPDGIDGGNNGVETKVVIRPPSDTFSQLIPGGQEQLIYAAGYFDGVAEPSTALRLRNHWGSLQVRAEAATPTGRVETAWCNLTVGVPNNISVHHRHALNSLADSLTLSVHAAGNSCLPNPLSAFVSSHPSPPEHRFGIIEPLNGGLSFEFDDIEIITLRFEPGIERRIFDDLEVNGQWSGLWQAFNPADLDVNAAAAHSGSRGLEIRPTLQTAAYLEHTLPTPTPQLGCRFSLDANFSSVQSPPPEVRIFAAQGSGIDVLRLRMRKFGSLYQLRAESGQSATEWIPLLRLPVPLDFRWNDGRLDLWVRGCGPSRTNCSAGLHLEVTNPEFIERLRLGSVEVPQDVVGEVTVDDILCLSEKDAGL